MCVGGFGGLSAAGWSAWVREELAALMIVVTSAATASLMRSHRLPKLTYACRGHEPGSV